MTLSKDEFKHLKGRRGDQRLAVFPDVQDNGGSPAGQI